MEEMDMNEVVCDNCGAINRPQDPHRGSKCYKCMGYIPPEDIDVRRRGGD